MYAYGDTLLTLRATPSQPAAYLAHNYLPRSQINVYLNSFPFNTHKETRLTNKVSK